MSLVNQVVLDILENKQTFKSFTKVIRYVHSNKKDSPHCVIIVTIFDLLATNGVILMSTNEDIIRVQQLLIEDYLKYLDSQISLLDYPFLITSHNL
jgi:hypothetical protein